MTDSRSRRLVFRADGNATIGLGHLVRLLALADMLRGLVPGLFIVREPTAAVTQLVTEAGWAIHALPAQALSAEADWLATSFLLPGDVLVLDGYDFTLAYQQRLRQSGCGLAYIDDLRAWPVVADVLINHSPGVTPADYQAPATARLLLGPAFSLLRQPFIAGAALPQASGDFTSALVCFGGADPLGLTARTLAALLTLPQVQRIGLLVGAAFGGDEALQVAARAQPEREITIYRNLGAAELVALLQAHAVAVVPASTVLIEALVLGRPAFTGYYADNQQALASYVHAHQQAFSVGNFADLAPSQLAVALRQGLAWLVTQPRQPYVAQLRPDLLRAEIQHLLAR
ncbi:UDP-2,4-diacetamido-2,4,6-trideoxy-beta-L-altropyranose hydrolase [Hymenobacter sp. BRD128]|uniref:UDP-2,4-diacetamido-2,4, 6-trideoxy-beta-L-altropyranose hydrolase n=1 Tax=Hymenobacter sp. BRD128 TaxID=2675878 RepID=UPI001563C5DC|nr:UDP-2,4-diacetamido-2,4,6-trideoxy-beta-L-altropyranose hydrolase [Hymenobacter sp. BRD128]QKG56757.1 UDP-2,4-diacetamido-2,4,6-trideoxy-beta-L-altropyranose hydrolase [Hymenobacter sp. BRD128]